MNDNLHIPHSAALAMPMQQAPKPYTNLDNATSSVEDALDRLQCRLDVLVSILAPVTRKPEPMPPQVGQPMLPKPFDASSPVVSSLRGWERTINAMTDKLLELENSLDI